MGAVDTPQSGGGKKRRVGIRIDMTPMVDVAFLLLIFFMVTTVFRTPQALEINLPPDEKTQVQVAESKVVTVRVLPDQPEVRNALVYVASLQMPLNDYLAIYGEANFITPASSGTVDAYLGVSFYPGGGVRNVLLKRYAPLLPTANNTSFAVDLPL